MLKLVVERGKRASPTAHAPSPRLRSDTRKKRGNKKKQCLTGTSRDGPVHRVREKGRRRPRYNQSWRAKPMAAPPPSSLYSG